MTEKLPRLLIVEDEDHLAANLKLNFEIDGYTVEVATTAREARQLLDGAEEYDVAVLDVMLPDSDGFELCRAIRDGGNFIPIIMLTARSMAADRVEGLEAGADDYVPKPFDLDELLARVRSQLRRRAWERQYAEDFEPITDGGSGEVLRFGDAVIDFDRHEATMRGQSVRLTSLELELLRYFSHNPGRVVSRAELLEKVWKLRSYPNTRTVDNFVMRLRRHFEADPAEPVYFHSIRGAGYKFLPDPAPAG